MFKAYFLTKKKSILLYPRIHIIRVREKSGLVIIKFNN